MVIYDKRHVKLCILIKVNITEVKWIVVCTTDWSYIMRNIEHNMISTDKNMNYIPLQTILSGHRHTVTQGSLLQRPKYLVIPVKSLKSVC